MKLLNTILPKIQRKWMKLRLRPIHVYALHHVCKKESAKDAYACDWCDIEEFKTKILELKKRNVHFISLTEAQEKLNKEVVRFKKYAVLTFDDGYHTLYEILPWLADQKVPVTLFVNGKYLDGVSYRVSSTEKYLSKLELDELDSSLIEIGSHGWVHDTVISIPWDDFTNGVIKTDEVIHDHPRYIPFYAYPYGRRSDETNNYLLNHNITPVLMNGYPNYQGGRIISREEFAV